MTDPLFWAGPEDVAAARPGATILLEGDEGRHAAAVRRLRVGESVVLADGEGRGVRGRVTAVGGSSVEVAVDELLEAPAEPLELVAVEGLAKGDRSEIAIVAMTELGVRRIVAWQASRSVVRWDGKVDMGLARWRAAAARAAKQSRRLRVPRLEAAGTGTSDSGCADPSWRTRGRSAPASSSATQTLTPGSCRGTRRRRYC